MNFMILRHFAEMKLVLAVYKIFEGCHGIADVWAVVLKLDDISALGLATAAAISASAFFALLHLLAAALGRLWAWLHASSKHDR